MKLLSFLIFFLSLSILRIKECIAMDFKPLRLSLYDTGCLFSGAGYFESDISQRTGWRLGDFMTSTEILTYVNISFGLWFKVTTIASSNSHLFGFSTDKSAASLSNSQSKLSLWYSQSSSEIIFRDSIGPIENRKIKTDFNYHWRICIIIQSKSGPQGFLNIYNSDNSLYLSSIMTPSFTVFDQDIFINTDYALESYSNQNACSLTKDLHLHFSTNTYNADQILVMQFSNRSLKPIVNLDFRLWVPNQATAFSKSQLYKNMIDENDTDNYAMNGDSTEEKSTAPEVTSFQFHNSAGFFLPLLSQSSSFTLHTVLVSSEVVIISFIPIFDISQLVDGQIMVILEDTIPQKVGIKKEAGYLYFWVQFQVEEILTYLRPGNSGERHILEFYRNFNLQTVINLYKAPGTRNTQLLTVTTPFTLINGLPMYIGGGVTSASLTFSVQDLLLATNGSVEFTVYLLSDPDLAIKDCIIQIIFSLKVNSSFCLLCSSLLKPTTDGQQCVKNYESLEFSLPLRPGLLSTNSVQPVHSTAQNYPNTAIISKKGDWDFLVLGYFDMRVLRSGSFPQIIFQISPLNEFYVFLQLHVISTTQVALKQHYNQQELPETTVQTLPNSLVEAWVLLGIGYKQSQRNSYIVYGTPATYNHMASQVFSTTTIYNLDVKYTELKISILPRISSSNKFETFDGLSSSVKILFGIPMNTFTSSYYQLESAFLQTPPTTIFPDFYTYLVRNLISGLGYACNAGKFFFDGTCVFQYACQNIILDDEPLLGTNNLFFDDTSSFECSICSGNCLTCGATSTECVTCRDNMRIDSVTKSCVICSSSQVYDAYTDTCVTTCTPSTLTQSDVTNRVCTSEFDPITYTISPKLQMRIFLNADDLDFQIVSASQMNYRIIFYCFINISHKYPYSFLGSIGPQDITFRWTNLPNHYQKEATFSIILMNQSTITPAVIITINGQTPSRTSSLFSNDSTITCLYTSNQNVGSSSYSVHTVVVSLIDNNSSNFTLYITSTNVTFGIRNVRALVKRCSPSCNSCTGGGTPMDCDSCKVITPAIRVVRNQCICPKGQYQHFNNCYSSPCYVCGYCSKNCISCEDITGFCNVCIEGYIISDGGCIPSTQGCPDSFQLNMKQVSFSKNCVKYRDLMVLQFEPGKVEQDAQIWNFPTNNFSQQCHGMKTMYTIGPNQLFSTTLNFEAQSYYHIGYQLGLSIIIINTFNTGSDFIQINVNSNQIFYESHYTSGSACSDSNFVSKIELVKVNSNSNSVLIEIKGLLNAAAGGFIIQNFLLYRLRSEDTLCAITNGDFINCDTCLENATKVSSVCTCNGGFFYQYDYIKKVGLCVRCSKNCVSCFGPTPYDCIICTKDHFKEKTNLCVIDCEEGTYQDLILKQCAPCHSTCMTCTDGKFDSCSSCYSGTYLYLNKCFTSCASAGPLTIPNEWKRTCEPSNLNQSLDIFSQQKDYYEDVVQKYSPSSDFLSVSKFYECGSPNNILGLFNQNFLLNVPTLGLHQIIQLSFRIFFTGSTITLNIHVVGAPEPTKQITLTQNTQVTCALGEMVPVSVIIQHEQTNIQSFQILTSSSSAMVPFGISSVKLYAIICHPTCLTCNGPLISNCTSCRTDSTYNSIMKSCICTDPKKGFGFDNTVVCTNEFSCYTCQPCQMPCATCFKADSQSCNSCFMPQYLYQSQCTYTCPENISFPTSTEQPNSGKCESCPFPCKTCNYSGFCFSCEDGYLFIPDQKKCVSICPPTLYFQSNSNECLTCIKNCKTCTGPLQSDCSSCVDAYFYDISSNQCTQCSNSCSTCIGPTNSDCTTCLMGSISFQPNPLNSTKYCTFTCQESPGYYISPSNDSFQCRECSQNCSACLSSAVSDCTSCNLSYYFAAGYCLPCDSSCFECSGQTNEECLSCTSPLKLNQGKCTDSCFSGYFSSKDLNTGQYSCKQCPSGCATCESETVCNSCQLSFYLANDDSCQKCSNNCQNCSGNSGFNCLKCNRGYFLQDKQCFQDCPMSDGKSFYGEPSSRTCKLCDASCLSCSGEFDFQCLSCAKRFYLNGGVCVLCPSNAVSCYLDPKINMIISTECQTGLILFEGNCFASCPLGSYQQNGKNCKRCHVACRSCTDDTRDTCEFCTSGYGKIDNTTTCVACNSNGGDMADCAQCSSTTFCNSCQSQILFQNRCFTVCPATYFKPANMKSCQNCTAPCNECTGATICTSCQDGYYLLNNGCNRCNPICETCSTGEWNNCKSCQKGFMLQVRTGGVGICTKTCDLGFLNDQLNRLCQECNESCMTCSDLKSCDLCADGYFKGDKDLCTKCNNNCQTCTTATLCLTCSVNSYFYEGSCLLACPAGTFGIGQMCVPCAFECQECSGNQSTCAKCHRGSFLSNSSCLPCNPICSECDSLSVCNSCKSGYFLEDNACKERCEKIGFYSDLSTFTCLSCDQSCFECDGPNARQCTSCSPGMYLRNLDLNLAEGVCESCHQNCETCFGPKNNECNSCAKGIKFIASLTACISNSSKFYFDQATQTLRKCNSLCKECNGPNINNCIACKDSYYLDVIENTCKLCSQECQTCSAYSQCNTCKESFYMLNSSTCTKQCPNGMRVEDGKCFCHSTCAKCSFVPQLNTSVCSKCVTTNLFMVSDTPSCVPAAECPDYRDLQTFQCVSSCSAFKFTDTKNKTCSSNPCPADTYTFMDWVCVENCPDGYYFSSNESRRCLKCDSKCKTCTGKQDNQCNSCIDGKFFHPEITTCKDQCLFGYSVSTTVSQTCNLCTENCKVCEVTLIAFEKACLSKCPIGYKESSKKCVKSYENQVLIKNKFTSKISIEQDLQIEAEMFSTYQITSIEWTLISSTDSSFISKFSSISSSTLVQFVPYLYLSSGNRYTFAVQILFQNNSWVRDEITIETQEGIKEGKFLVDKTTGKANKTRFTFSFSDWAADSQLYSTLNVYELVGLIYPEDSASQSTERTPSEYQKDHLIQLHQNVTFTRSNSMQFIFPPFERDISFVCELSMHTASLSLKSFSYLMIDLKKSDFLDEKSSLDLLTDQLGLLSNQNTNTNSLLLYSLTLQKLLPVSDNWQTQRDQQNLRTQARRLKISQDDLPDCDPIIDCFNNGVCATKFIDQVLCICNQGYTSSNCEWSINQANVLAKSAIQLMTSLPLLTSHSQKFQILEVLITYSNYLNSIPQLQPVLSQISNQYQSEISYFLKSPTLDDVTGQLLQRSLTTFTSSLTNIQTQSVTTLLGAQKALQHKSSNNLNVGESLISSSDSCNSLLKPLLVQPIRKSSKRGSSKSDVDIKIDDLTVSFPPAVVYNNKKQVVQISKWKKPSRQNPNAISQLVAISMSKEGSEVPVNNLSVPIIFSLPKSIPSPVSSNPEAILCTYFDENTSTFSSEGCSLVKETITDIVCSCNHLTEFQAASNPDVTQDTISLASLVQTVTEGKKIALAKQSTKQAITKLPTLKLGARSSSLTAQIISSTKKKVERKKQLTVLFEDKSLVIQNYSFEGKTEVLPQKVKVKANEEKIKLEKFFFKPKYFLLYSLSIFTFGLFFSLRANFKINFIPPNTKKAYLKFWKKQTRKIRQKKRTQVSANNQTKPSRYKKEKTEKAIKENFQEIISPRFSSDESLQVNSHKRTNSNSSLDNNQSSELKSPPFQNLKNKINISAIEEVPEEYQLDEDCKNSANYHFNIDMIEETKLNIEQQPKNKIPRGTRTPPPCVEDEENRYPLNNSKTKKQKTKIQKDITTTNTKPIESYDFEITQKKIITIDPLAISKRHLRKVKKHHEKILKLYQVYQIGTKTTTDTNFRNDFYQKQLVKTNFNTLMVDTQHFRNVNKQQKESSNAKIFLFLSARKEVEKQKLKKMILLLNSMNFTFPTFQTNQSIEITQTNADQQQKQQQNQKSQSLISQEQNKKDIRLQTQIVKGFQNQLNEIQGISTIHVFQMYSLFASQDKIFSNRFTKCLYLSSQIAITLIINILYTSLSSRGVGNIDTRFIINERLIVSILIGYFIPYFFFGLLTKVFSQASKKFKLDKITQINKISFYFAIIYAIIGIIILATCILSLVLLTEKQQSSIENGVVLAEQIVALILSNLLIDGLFFIMLFIFESITSRTTFLHFFIACRGFYYYDGFDDPIVYQFYYKSIYAEENTFEINSQFK